MSYKIAIGCYESFNDYKLLKKKLDTYLQPDKRKSSIEILLPSISRNEVRLITRYASEYSLNVIKYENNTTIKNARYAVENAEAVVVFDDGTDDAMDIMKQYGNYYLLKMKVIQC